MWRIGVILLFSVLAVSNVWASTPDEIREYMMSGEYDRARADAEALNTAEGFALAAESLAAQIFLGEVEKPNKSSKKARELAKKALELDPEDYNANLQYALTYGFYARTSGTLKAWRKKLPAKSLAAIHESGKDFPDDPRFKALLGAWHLGIIEKIGEKKAGDWFEANLDEGKKYYDLARAASPDDIMIGSNYAMALLAIDPERFSPELRPELDRIMALPAANDVERKIHLRIGAMLEHYADHDGVKTHASAFLHGDPIPGS